MKKLVTVMMAALVVALSGCGSLTKVKGPTVVLLDHQNAALGKGLPNWVVASADGTTRGVAKALDIDENRIVFVINGNGSTLDFVKAWTKLVDARSEIANSFAETLGEALKANLSGSEAELQKTIDQSITAAKNIEMNGLVKEAEYWLQNRIYANGVNPKKATSDQYKDRFDYYVVYSMAKSDFDAQLKAAMAGIQSNTSEMELIKQIVTEKVQSELIPSAISETVE